jgi:hypothetical protein
MDAWMHGCMDACMDACMHVGRTTQGAVVERSQRKEKKDKRKYLNTSLLLFLSSLLLFSVYSASLW